jgi:hypothetical protein
MRQLVGLLCGCVLLLAPLARATVVVVPTLEEMTHRSDVVIHAVVAEVTVIEEVPGRLVTKNTLLVKEAVRGAKAGDRLVVRQIGGALHGEVSWIAGQHHFTVGEEVIFFGMRPSVLKGEAVSYGIGFGLFRVEEDVDGTHIKEVSGDVAQAVAGPGGKLLLTEVKPRHFESLSAFLGHLRAVVEGENSQMLPQKRILGPTLPGPTHDDAHHVEEK